MFTRKCLFKTLGALIAVVVLIALLPGTVMAGFSPDFYLYTTGDGTAEWTDVDPGEGAHSVKLSWPPGDNETSVVFSVPEGLKVEDLDSWNFLFKTPTMDGVSNPYDYAPNITFYLDTDLENYEDKNYDTAAVIWTYDSTLVDEWVTYESSNDGLYTIWSNKGGPVMKTMNWASFKGLWSEAVVTEIRIGNGGIGTLDTITFYVDDLTLLLVDETSIVYELEPPPDEVYVDDDFDEDTTGWGYDAFASIQDGIDAVAEGGTVYVAAGEYVELLNINKPLTMLGPNADIDGRSETRNSEALITYPEGDNSKWSLIAAEANGITVKGFTFTNDQLINGDESGGWDLILVGENITFINNRVISQAQRKIPFKIQGPFNGAGDPDNNYGGAVVKNNYFSGPNTSWNPVVMQGIGATVQDNIIESGAAGIQIQPYTNTVGGIVSGNNVSAYMVSIWHNYQTGGKGLWIYEDNYLTTSVPPTTAFRYGAQTDWRGIRLETHRPNVEIRNNVFDDGDNDDYWVGDDWFERTSVGILYWANLEADSHIDVHDNEFINVEKNVENQAPATGNLNGVFENNTFAKSAYIENGYIIYTSIQEAIDAASDGDTILVGPGTYIEDISVTGKNFNLIGTVDGEGNPISIIQGSLNIDNNAITTELTTTIENIYFDMVSKHLLTLKKLNGGLIKNCVFDGNDRFMGSGDEKPFNGIELKSPNNNIMVESSTFKNGLYVSINGYFTGLTVKDSTFTDVKSGINLISGGDLTVENTHITVIAQGEENDTYGIRFGDGSGNTPNLTVTGGSISVDKGGLLAEEGTYHSAIILRDSASGTLSVTGMRIDGEVVNLSSTTLDASPNWWGSPTGPAEDSIIGDVTYIPWCADSDCGSLGYPLEEPFDPGNPPEEEGLHFGEDAAHNPVIVVVGDVTVPGGLQAGQEGMLIFVARGGTLAGNSPCVHVTADNVTIMGEYPGEQVCQPDEDSPGILVDNGVQGLRILNMRFDGSQTTNITAIEFTGAVSDFHILNNDIDAATFPTAIHFGGEVSGEHQIQGNMFRGATIDAGENTIDARFNSWGVNAALEITNVTTSPFTHVDISMISKNPDVDNWLNQVFAGEQITYEVKADLKKVMGADFVLEFPANLTVASTVAGDVFDSNALAVDGNKIRFMGYQEGSEEDGELIPAEAVDGDDMLLYTVTFNAESPGRNLPLSFDETTDEFSMSPGYGPSLHIYANALRGVELGIIDRPTLDITGLGEPFYVGVMSHEITNTICNPTTGGDWSESPLGPDAIGWIRISDVNLADIASLQFYYGGVWHDFTVQNQVGGEAVSQDGDDVVARFGNYNFGFDIPLEDPQWCDIDKFRVIFTKPGAHQVTVSIYDMMDTAHDYDDDVLLVSAGPTEITVVDANFEITGKISMQGRTDRSGVLVTLLSEWYDPITVLSNNYISSNLGLELNGGQFTFTTFQPCYLNVTAGLEKLFSVDGAGTIAALELKGGNAVWTDNIINVQDASMVGTNYNNATFADDADVNFDGRVSIQDLALVGGNYGLTSEEAYADWMP